MIAVWRFFVNTCKQVFMEELPLLRKRLRQELLPRKQLLP